MVRIPDTTQTSRNVSEVPQLIDAATGAHVRFGSKADMGLPLIDVCFTPKSGHGWVLAECPLYAKSGSGTTTR
jgi:hypothetical protein